MKALINLLMKYKKTTAAILTLVICIVEYYIIPVDSDYTFFITILCTGVLIASLYLVLSKKRTVFAPIISCSLMAIIFANKLYSNERVVTLFPVLANIPPVLLSSGLIIAILIIYFICTFIRELIAEISTPSKFKEELTFEPKPMVGEDTSQEDPVLVVENRDAVQPLGNYTNILRTLLMFLGSIAIVVLTFVSYEWLKTGSENGMSSDIVEFASVILSNGAIILIVFIAVLFSIYALVEMVRFLFSHLWPVESPKKAQNKVTFPWIISFFGVLILFYLGFSVTGFTLDDFTEITSEARYIALPLTIIVIFITFWVLVRISHSLLLLIIELNPKELKESLSRRISAFMKNYINDIGNTLINAIILKTIKTALDYVAFIPSFFGSFYEFTFGTDEYDQIVDVDDTLDSEMDEEASYAEL